MIRLENIDLNTYKDSTWPPQKPGLPGAQLKTVARYEYVRQTEYDSGHRAGLTLVD